MSAGGLSAHLPVLQVVVPLVAAPACVLITDSRRVWWLAFVVSSVCLAIALGLLAQVGAGQSISYLLGGWAAPWGIEYRIDIANGLVLVVVTWFVLSKTSLGLRIRSVGENPSVAEVSGIDVAKTRYLCVTIGGMLMGLAGAVYSLDYNPVWNYNFLMGWGFIALALVFFSMWNPFILLAGSLLFGTLWQLSLNPQLVLPGVMSRYIWRTVPFVITLVVLLIMSTKWFRTKWGAAKPEALGQPYVKE